MRYANIAEKILCPKQRNSYIMNRTKHLYALFGEEELVTPNERCRDEFVVICFCGFLKK